VIGAVARTSDCLRRREDPSGRHTERHAAELVATQRSA